VGESHCPMLGLRAIYELHVGDSPAMLMKFLLFCPQYPFRIPGEPHALVVSSNIYTLRAYALKLRASPPVYRNRNHNHKKWFS
jgi:hypothetical protein